MREGEPDSLAFHYCLSEELSLTAAAYRHVERWEVGVFASATPGDDDEIGHARVLIFNLEPGHEIGDFVDRVAGMWVEQDTTGRPTVGAVDDNDDRPPVSHVLVLDQVWLRPDARGRGLGPIVAASVIERLGRGCHLAACYPAPFEAPDQAPEERARSIQALGRLWSTVGFTHWQDGVWMLSLDGSDRHPWLTALIQARHGDAQDEDQPGSGRVHGGPLPVH